MANRSDFFNAKLPRYLKRMITLGEAYGNYDKTAANQMRKAFIDAHANHVAFKLRRNTENNRDSSGE
jgi:hypothetical protein